MERRGKGDRKGADNTKEQRSSISYITLAKKGASSQPAASSSIIFARQTWALIRAPHIIGYEIVLQTPPEQTQPKLYPYPVVEQCKPCKNIEFFSTTYPISLP